MEAKHDDASRGRADPAGAAVELIVHNGRQKGTRRPLTQPLTLIGRALGCDLRLNVDGVQPLHCGLVHGFDGLSLRDFQGSGGTLVNGQPTTGCTLRHGDILSVGPFQFQVAIQGPLPAQRLAEMQAKHTQEKDALRIQAAAVAAQQAALAEEEARLEQRRAALQQQEEQLGTHLDEKRKRLLEIRDQARAAHAALKTEQITHETKVKESNRQLDEARRQLDEAKKQVDGERQRLAQLVGRLQRRWQRQLAAERAASRRREEEIIRQKRQLEKDRDQLQRERETLYQARLRYNGESELGRRQLQADWEAFRQEQAQDEERREQQAQELRKRTRELDERQTALALAEQELEDHRQHWQEVRLALEKEVEGLEHRIRNYRRKIADLERDVALLQNQVATAAQPAAPAAETVSPGEQSADSVAFAVLTGQESPPAPSAPPVPPAPPAPVVAPAPPAVPAPTDDSLVQEQLAHLEQLSGELADQRLHLIEQCQRLVAAQHRWEKDRDAAASDLEELGKRLHARELELQQREHALEAAESRQRQMHEEARALRRHLEAWQSRLSSREATWEGDRERLLTALQAREKLAEERLTALTQLHQRWMRRRRREIQWLQNERTAFAQLRQECATLRQDFIRRGGLLEREQRTLAEQALALEEFQQELIGKSAQPASAARRLQRLRQRWASLSAAAQKAVTEQRDALEKEAAALQAYYTRLKKQTDKITAQEAELARQLSTWEQAQVVAQSEMGRMRTDLLISQSQRDRYEKQVNELHDEVERLARLLLDEAEAVAAAQSRAA